MFTVSLSLVRPSPSPIRKTWDEDKMQELAASIKERGVIVPIKVRPMDGAKPCRVHGWYGTDGEGSAYDRGTGGTCEGCCGMVVLDNEGEETATWEIVYGHRRVEAARRAGLEDIPAIVEEANDTDALIQALIENVQREDMEPMDEARALREIQNLTGWSLREMERRGLGHKEQMSIRLALLDEMPEIQEMITRRDPGPGVLIQSTLGLQHVREARAAIESPQERAKVLQKVASEGLTRYETRAVADAYKAADSPELRDAVLNTSGKLGDSDRILQVAQMSMGAAGLVERHESERRQSFEEYDQAAKDFFDFMKLSKQMVKAAQGAARYGKFSPEGAQFAIGRIDRLISELETLKEALSHVD